MIEQPGTTAAWVRRGIAFSIGALVVLGLVWLAVLALNVLILIFVAILLAAGLEPVVKALRARLPVGRRASILLAYGAFVVSVVLVAFLAVPAAINQFDQLSSGLPPMLDRARVWTESLEPPALSTSLTALVNTVARNITTVAPPKPDQVVAVGLTVAEAVVSLVTLFTIVFFWLTEHARLQRYALGFVPPERRAGAREAWNEVEARLGLWVRGQLTIMGSIALGTGILYSVLGLPSALLLGLIAGLAEAIPLIGPILGAIPALLVAATVSPQLVGIVALAYIAIQFIEGNVLVPLIMRNAIGMSPLVVILSLLVGGAAGGIVGALLAVPIVAAIGVVAERLRAHDPSAEARSASAEPGGSEAALAGNDGSDSSG